MQRSLSSPSSRDCCLSFSDVVVEMAWKSLRPASLTCEACQLGFLAGKVGSTLEVVFSLFIQDFKHWKQILSLLCKSRPIYRSNLDQLWDVFDGMFFFK